MADGDDDRVEIHDSVPAARRAEGSDEPLLDIGTKIALVLFAIAVVAAIGAVAVAVSFY